MIPAGSGGRWGLIPTGPEVYVCLFVFVFFLGGGGGES